MVSEIGPLAFYQAGDACPLPEALCLNGIYLTGPFIRKLIKHLGGTVKGSSVKALASQLFAIVFHGDQVKEEKATEAMKTFLESQEDKLEKDLDSDLEDVLECHKQDNYNTSDLKDLENLRKKKAKLAKHAAKNHALSLPIPAPKAKRKAKAKPKAKSFAEKLRHSLSTLRKTTEQDEVVPETVAAPPEEPLAAMDLEVPEGPASSSQPPRAGQRGPGIEQTPEAIEWPPPPGCSIGYSKVNQTTAWQAKLPVKTKFNVPYSRVSEQNTLYVQFDTATFGKELSQQVVADLNSLQLEDILYFRKMVAAGTKKSLSSAEARCMCCRWLQSWYDSQEH